MKILADESLDGPVVAWLKTLGHDVIWAAETLSGASDVQLVRRACDEGRVIITSDRDFGELVFRQGAHLPGLALLRIRAKSASAFLESFQNHWTAVEGVIAGSFVVVSRGRVRVRPIFKGGKTGNTHDE